MGWPLQQPAGLPPVASREIGWRANSNRMVYRLLVFSKSAHTYVAGTTQQPSVVCLGGSARAGLSTLTK